MGGAAALDCIGVGIPTELKAKSGGPPTIFIKDLKEASIFMVKMQGKKYEWDQFLNYWAHTTIWLSATIMFGGWMVSYPHICSLCLFMG